MCFLEEFLTIAENLFDHILEVTILEIFVKVHITLHHFLEFLLGLDRDFEQLSSHEEDLVLDYSFQESTG